MKQKIMEVLLQAENNLTQEEISWAIHNIPNDGTTVGRKFDHSKSNIFEACGYMMDDLESLQIELKKIKDETEGRNSNFLEAVLAKGSTDLHNFIIIRGLSELMNKSDDDPLAKLRKLLDNL